MFSLLRTATGGIFLLLVLAIGACSSTGTPRPGNNPDEITRQEIVDSEAITALEVVMRLRPLWLRAPLERSHNRQTAVVVVVNGLMMDSVDALHEIDAVNVDSIRWLDSAEAGRLPGLGSRHVAGAIVVEMI